MPELPEVETTTRGLRKEIVGLKISDVWTDLNTKDKRKIDTVANTKYFVYFKKEVLGEKIIGVERRAKNILIKTSGDKIILVHMKMTGHLLFGKYTKKITRIGKSEIVSWFPKKSGPLRDPYNRFIHVVFELSGGKHLVFCDSRKFGKITLLNTKNTGSKHLKNLGPEPLENEFNLELFKERISKKPKGNIKTVLMDQSILSGIGNIYSDEVLWHAGIHPKKKVAQLKEKDLQLMFKAIKKLLTKGIFFGGDSMSDYRNIYGLPGRFQLHHMAYRRTGEKCRKNKCNGVIMREIINNRSAHFCSKHQKSNGR